jgi:hypothetical protein
MSDFNDGFKELFKKYDEIIDLKISVLEDKINQKLKVLEEKDKEVSKKIKDLEALYSQQIQNLIREQENMKGQISALRYR